MIHPNAKIIYYTSNRERQDFEERVKANLLIVAGNVRIISISHKHIYLGGKHMKNLLIYIGLKASFNNEAFT